MLVARQSEVADEVSDSGGLVAVLAQRFNDRFDHAFVEVSIATTQVTRAFSTHANVTVGFTRSTMFDFAGRSQAKTLFRAFVGFHLVHWNTSEANLPVFSESRIVGKTDSPLKG